MKIGVFDSGLGGLSVLSQFISDLPEYDYVYLGDNARVPYGGRSKEAILEFTKQGIDFLFRHNCQLIIIACNTASAEALRDIQASYLPSGKKVLGVIRPTAEHVVEQDYTRVGVIGTRATISSGSYEREIHKLETNIKVFQLPTPLLVPLIEEGETAWEGTDLLLKKYLRFFSNQAIEALILGCTHYGLIKNQIKAVLGNEIEVISQEEVVSRKLKMYLAKHTDLESQLSKKKTRQLFVTDLSVRYKEIAAFFFHKKHPVWNLNKTAI